MRRRVISTILMMFALTALALALHLNQLDLLKELATLLFNVGKTGLP